MASIEKRYRGSRVKYRDPLGRQKSKSFVTRTTPAGSGKTFGPAMLGPAEFHLGALDFGSDSVDGWLTGLAAAELGIAEEVFIDPTDHTVALGGRRVALSPLEFGVMALLVRRRGNAVTRADFRLWCDDHDGASNVVDVVIRGLRVKAGTDSKRIVTTRGVGYRLI